MKAKLVQLAGTASLLVLMSFTAHAKLSAKSYISNGLIGHWDGIENVAYGQAHDDAPTGWYELTGKIGGYFKTSDAPNWSFANARGLVTQKEETFVRYSQSVPACYKDAYTNSHYTVEVAYTMNDGLSYVKIIGLGYSKYYVAVRKGDPSVGFGGPGMSTTASTQWPGFRLMLASSQSVLGSHTFSCQQNGSNAFIDFDGVATASKDDVPAETTARTNYALQFGADYESSGKPSVMDGTHHAIRFYNRPLTTDEIAVNRAVDQVRFFDRDPATCTLPDGWRFTGEGDDLALERRFGVLTVNDPNGGTAVVVGSETAEFWAESTNDSMTVTMTATPAAGYKFYGWRGIVSAEGDPKALTVTAVVTGNVTAVFYKTGPHTLSAKSYILDDLIGHWDGIENVAYGQSHSGDATQWKELTGNVGGYFRIGDVNWSFSDTGLVSLPGTAYCIYSRQPPSDSYTKAFNSAKYTVEIAYTAPAEQSRIKFLGLGYADHYVAYTTDSDSGLGFSGPGFSGNRLRPSFTIKPDGISGSHTFSCRQDGSRADIDFDGVLTGVKDDIVPRSDVDTRWALQLGCDYDSIRAGQNNVFPLDGTYHSIRFYSRSLTTDEIAVNRAVDQVRYCGFDPVDVILPDGWRFNTAEGIALEQKFAVTSSDATMGLVSVGDGEPAASADCWVEKAVPTMVKLTAVPAKDYKFVRWEGAIAGDNLKAAIGTFAVSGNVTAIFKKVSGLLLLFR